MYPSVVAGTMLLYRWAQERAKIQRTLDAFSIEDAKCFYEDDRNMVQDNIIAFLRDAQLVWGFFILPLPLNLN